MLCADPHVIRHLYLLVAYDCKTRMRMSYHFARPLPLAPLQSREQQRHYLLLRRCTLADKVQSRSERATHSAFRGDGDTYLPAREMLKVI